MSTASFAPSSDADITAVEEGLFPLKVYQIQRVPVFPAYNHIAAQNLPDQVHIQVMLSMHLLHLLKLHLYTVPKSLPPCLFPPQLASVLPVPPSHYHFR